MEGQAAKNYTSSDRLMAKENKRVTTYSLPSILNS